MSNQHLSFTKGQFTVTTDPASFQLEAIHDYLSQSSWAPDIDVETVRISVQNSLCFALLDGTRQIGSPVLSLTMPLLVICATSMCWMSIRKAVLVVG